MSRQIRTDLAIEQRENVGGDIPGVQVDEFAPHEDIKITRVRIVSEEGEKAIGKPQGNYITVEYDSIDNKDRETKEQYARAIAGEIRQVMGDKKNALIVGLGNRYVTPDALGPRTCDSIFVTRHIKTYIPECIDERAANLCAIAPGVLGVTGIETSEVIKGVVDQIEPEVIIAIDALASRSTKRIGTNVQISDTGISPGAGIGNKRKELSESTLGVPVVAIGVPTVTYAYTIAGDLVEAALGKEASSQEAQHFINEVVAQEGGDLIVTPKEIDVMVDKTAKLIADSINIALNEELQLSEIEAYML